MAFKTPITSLQELKRQMEKGQEIQVDQEGKLHLPDDEEVQKQYQKIQELTKMLKESPEGDVKDEPPREVSAGETKYGKYS